ncbi:hypothetical protein T492DRAFT_854220 [Pavlovales sp. CCMP2436]|nr:hypothetical protein T492DRAFT_854220 [Pavlovales sp. CCMP2436]
MSTAASGTPTKTSDFAAGGGHLEVLRYAHEHGCPWVFKRCLAVLSRHAEVVEYLRAAQASLESSSAPKIAAWMDRELVAAESRGGVISYI